MKRIRWDIEEVVAIIDIYFRTSAGEIENLNAELLKLSQALNVRADCLHIKHDDKFRNLNGMQCIFENIRYVVTDGDVGLSNANKLHYTVVDVYYNEREKFDSILVEFWKKYS